MLTQWSPFISRKKQPIDTQNKVNESNYVEEANLKGENSRLKSMILPAKFHRMPTNLNDGGEPLSATNRESERGWKHAEAWPGL